jgi:hypothetical protein
MRFAILSLVLLLMAALVANAATVNNWVKDPGNTGSTQNNVTSGVCVWLTVDETDSLNAFSSALTIKSPKVSVEWNPNIGAATLGSTITVYRCDKGGSSSTTNECRPLYKDLDGDGVIDQTPLTGAVGYAGWADDSPTAIAIKINTLPGVGVDGRVKVCGLGS